MLTTRMRRWEIISLQMNQKVSPSSPIDPNPIVLGNYEAGREF
jgi:hypothetical protein